MRWPAGRTSTASWRRPRASRSRTTDGGTLLVALHRDHLGELARLEAFQERLGFASERLTPQALRAMEPSLSPRVLGGLHVREEHRVDPAAVLRALETAVQKLGGEVRRGEQVRLDAAERRVRWTLDGREQVATAPRIVVAAGVHSGELVDEAAGLRPVKGQCLRLKGPPLLTRTVRTPDVYLVPRADGELYVGASIEEVGFTPGVFAREVTTLLHEAWRVLPETQELEIVGTAFGYRPVARDDRPRLGTTQHEGVFLATGHGRHGVLLLPSTAEGVADLVLATTGHAAQVIAPFAPPQPSSEAPTTGLPSAEGPATTNSDAHHAER